MICQRCTKDVSGFGIHTCTPSELVRKLEAENAALQARIDTLMLEYCPDEMTESQKENWAKHQRPVSDEEQGKIDKELET